MNPFYIYALFDVDLITVINKKVFQENNQV